MGKPPASLGDPSDPDRDRDTVREIIEKFTDHPSVRKIRDHISHTISDRFSLPLATKEEIHKIMSDIDVTKSCGPDKIPPKFVKMSANILDTPMVNIINENISTNRFSENAKHANVPPIFKKSEGSGTLDKR